MRERHHATGTIRSLQFVSEPAEASAWIGAVRNLLQGGRRTVTARLLDDAADGIASALAAEFGGLFKVSERNGQATAEATPEVSGPSDITLLIGGDAERTSSALLDYLDTTAVTLVAPVTDRYYKNLPLYLISIPKAGTHLLFRLAEALGYAAGGVAPGQPKGGHWYYLLNSNAHTTTREFFRDELQRAPFGNRAHPFMRSPALFNYRNPFDILVSEANYWHVDGNSPLSVLLGHLSFEQRIARLVDDRWLLGSIRDRVGEFAAWLDCANIIPVSFEEIVGDAGGGSDMAFDALVWSLQLKLHAPGIPQDICSVTSDRSSPTFREGRINGWREILPTDIVRQIEALPQDFMETFGYDASSVLPRHAEAFRHRPLKVMSSSHFSVPYLIETDFLGHNIVSYRQHNYAVPLSAGAMDLRQLSPEELSKFVNDENLSSVRARVVAKEAEKRVLSIVRNLIESGEVRDVTAAMKPDEPDQMMDESEAPVAPMPHGDDRVGHVRPLGSFFRYNLFQRRDCIIAAPMRLGPIDPNDYELKFNPRLIASRDLTAARVEILSAWIRWAVSRLGAR